MDFVTFVFIAIFVGIPVLILLAMFIVALPVTLPVALALFGLWLLIYHPIAGGLVLLGCGAVAYLVKAGRASA